MDKFIEALCNNMYALTEAICHNMNAVIGVLGTVIGTILGWILSRLTTGKLFLHIKKSSIECSINEKEAEPIRHYKEIFIISLYNSANVPKTIRNLRVVFKDASNKKIIELDAEDSSTIEIRTYGSVSNVISIVNIDSKIGKEITAFYQTWDVSTLRKARKVELHYQTEKMRNKKKIMWKYDYSKIGKEQENG